MGSLLRRWNNVQRVRALPVIRQPAITPGRTSFPSHSPRGLRLKKKFRDDFNEKRRLLRKNDEEITKKILKNLEETLKTPKKKEKKRKRFQKTFKRPSRHLKENLSISSRPLQDPKRRYQEEAEERINEKKRCEGIQNVAKTLPGTPRGPQKAFKMTPKRSQGPLQKIKN